MMKRKSIATILCNFILCSLCYTQINWFAKSAEPEIPLWVQRTQEGLSIEDAFSFYFGIGVSNESQEKADIKARDEFAKSVEVKVKSVYKENIKFRGKRYSEKIDISSSALTDISIRGIAITERFYDGDIYYSLMKIGKDEYNRNFRNELDKEQERLIAQTQAELNQKQLEFEKEKQSNIMKEKKSRESVRHRKEKSRINSEKHLQRKANRKDKLNTYRSFLSEIPPEKIISFRNGELSTESHTLSLHLGISPITIENIYYSFKFWKLELATNLIARQNQLERQDIIIKYQILPNIGEFHKISVSFGYLEFLYSISAVDNVDSLQPEFSPFLVLNMTLPELFHSYGSLYADSRKVSLGFNSFPTYDNLGNRLSLLFELNYIRHPGFRNRFNDTFLYQTGLRFKTSDIITTSFTYENHETFIFSTDFVF